MDRGGHWARQAWDVEAAGRQGSSTPLFCLRHGANSRLGSCVQLPVVVTLTSSWRPGHRWAGELGAQVYRGQVKPLRRGGEPRAWV